MNPLDAQPLPLHGLDATTAALLAGRDRFDPSRSFAAVLGRARTDQRPAPVQQAREAARHLVAISFVQPVLKQLRDSTAASPPFAPTQAERQFGSLLDAELAQRIVHASDFPLVERLTRQLLSGTSA